MIKGEINMTLKTLILDFTPTFDTEGFVSMFSPLLNSLISGMQGISGLVAVAMLAYIGLRFLVSYLKKQKNEEPLGDSFIHILVACLLIFGGSTILKLFGIA